MTLDKELKEAVRRLPSAEKDKLIFRLLKKDLDLANRLYFELVSCESKDDRRKQARKEIEKYVNMSRRSCRYATPGILMMEMRDASGIVNEHIRITKDKYGEVELQLFILKEYLKIYNDSFTNTPAGKSHTLNIYLIVKIFKIMILLKKMHEDIQFDFEDNIKETGCLFGDNPGLMNASIDNGLDVNWLIGNKIPDNIAEVEKDLRKQGYLK
jgi:hypothetical protein